MNYLDLHADTLTMLRTGDLYQNENDVGLQRAEQAFESYVQTFAIWASPEHPFSDEQAMTLYQRMVALVDGQKEHARLCTSRADLEQALATHKAAVLFSVEDLAVMGSYAGNIRELGFTSAMLTWNEANQYATGAATDQTAGLTDAGKEMVHHLDRQGIILDVSHLSDAGFQDLCELTPHAFIASHSNCRSLCNHPRNLTDDEIREIIRRGGLIGMNIFRPFIREETPVTLAHLAAHIEHVLALGGKDAVSLGCDLDGCSGLFPEEFQGIQDLPVLYEYLLRQNYPETLVKKIFFDNGLTFLRRTLP